MVKKERQKFNHFSSIVAINFKILKKKKFNKRFLPVCITKLPSGPTSQTPSRPQELNQQSPQDQRDQLVPFRQIYRHSNHVSETRDDAAAELKSSSFNDDLSASLLLLVCITSVSANKVLTGCRSNSIPISRMRF